MRAVPREADGGDTLGMRMFVPSQTLPCPHLPHLSSTQFLNKCKKVLIFVMSRDLDDQKIAVHCPTIYDG